MGRFDVPLTELEAVHVPVEQQVESEPVAEPRTYVDPEDADRQALLGVTSAGRLRVR